MASLIASMARFDSALPVSRLFTSGRSVRSHVHMWALIQRPMPRLRCASSVTVSPCFESAGSALGIRMAV